MDGKFMKHSLLDDLQKFNSYQELFKDMTIALWRWDVDSEELIPFFGLDKLLGYQDMNELKKVGFWVKQWHPEDRPIIQKKIFECINERCKEFDVINRIKHKDGHYVWLYTKATLDFHSQTHIKLICISINIDKIQDSMTELHLEKESYQNFLKATRAATWSWNVPSGSTNFDERWASILGYTLDELKPISVKTWESLVHPEDLEYVNQQLQDVFDKKNEYYVVDYRMKHKQGYDVWISDRGKVISWTDDGKPLDMVGIHIDISYNKKIEAELFQREKHYKGLVESSYDIIYTIDLDGRLTFLSKAWERLLGHNLEETMGKNYHEFIHPDDSKRLEKFFFELIETEKHIEIEGFRLKAHDHTYRWYNTNATLLTDEDGNVLGFVGTARDITARKRLQEKLSIERDLFKKTLLSVADAVISTDKDGKIVIMNTNAEQLFGILEKDAKDKYLCSVIKLFIEDSNEAMAHSLESLLQTEHVQFINQATLLNQKGKQISVELSIAPIQDVNKHNEGIVIIIRDISEKLRKQKEIEFLSYHDYLTGLYNRRYMDLVIQDIDKDRFLPIGIMILDVNDLKEMNDHFGHQSGDDLLKKISRILESLIEKKNVLGRIGGDEFLILAPNTSEEEIYGLKHHLIDSFSKESFRDTQISVALGYSIKNDADIDIYEVMRQADDFMYEDKEKRRNSKK